MADPETSYQNWFQASWRPAMAYQYLVVCLFDFFLAPIMLGIYAMYTKDFHSWDPMTLRGGGLYHLSMGAVTGVSAWSRGQEKMMALNTANTTAATEEKCDPDKVNDRAN